MTEEIESKLEEIKQILDKDLLAADLKVSIFGSAAISFKQDSLCSPFPKAYIKDGVKDFENLVSDLMETYSEHLEKMKCCRSAT
jgi:ARTD15 N-terminal domain